MKTCNNVLTVQNKDGNTVLHIACIKGHSFLINEFYKLGSNISMKNIKGETILHCAVKCGKLNVVKQVFDMMNTHIGLKCTDINDRNALHTAVLCRNKNIDIIRFLVNEGSNIINIDNQGNTIIQNLNRLEKSSINIQIKTFLKKSLYDSRDTYITDQTRTTTSTTPPTETTTTTNTSYSDFLENHPEYAPYVIDNEDGYSTIVVTYDKNPTNILSQKTNGTNKRTNGPLEGLPNQKPVAKKRLPIKYKRMFEYFEDVEPTGNTTNNTTRKINTEPTGLYKEILFICLLFIIAFIFYYE